MMLWGEGHSDKKEGHSKIRLWPCRTSAAMVADRKNNTSSLLQISNSTINIIHQKEQSYRFSPSHSQDSYSSLHTL